MMDQGALDFPQVLLLGNGLNLAGGATKWEELIRQIKTNSKIKLDEETMRKVPYPLLAVLATGDRVDSAIKRS